MQRLGGAQGSSLLARGKPNAHGVESLEAGIIPACAGKTPLSTDARPVGRDHPCLRGENRMTSSYILACGGSSLLARGKPTDIVNAARKARIIPACAGKTVVSAVAIYINTDHPCLRGENRHRSVTSKSLVGSSLLARGKHEPGVKVDNCLRIIPACAGKTLLDLRLYQGKRPDFGN